MTKRFDNALSAFRNYRFKFAVELLTALQKIDNERYRKNRGDAKIEITDGNALFEHICTKREGYELNELALYALDRATCDAVMVVMYAGRDGDANLRHGDRYDEDHINAKFAEWWEYLCMDSEHYVREILREKWPLDRYLKVGMRMFRIDER